MNAEPLIAPGYTFRPSLPISIPRNDEHAEYSLKKSEIDPTKSSPPNSWNARLLKRLNLKSYKVNNL